MNIELAIQRGVREVLWEGSPEHATRKLPPLFVKDISFAAGGNSGSYVKSGFSQQETSGRWTEGREARLALSFPTPSRNYRLTALVEPYLHARHASQRVEILVNGELCLEDELNTSGTQSLTTTFRTSGPTTIAFILPDAISPAQLNEGNDPRELALAFQSVSIFPVDLHGGYEWFYKVFQSIRRFFLAKPSRKVASVLMDRGVISPGTVAENFGDPESEGRWTLGSSARVSFTVLPTQWPHGLELRLFGRRMELAGRKASVTLMVNDAVSKALNFSDKGWTSFSIPIPLEQVKKQTVHCQWSIENPISPLSSGEGDDHRLLGMLVGRLELRSPSWFKHRFLPAMGITFFKKPTAADKPGRSF